MSSAAGLLNSTAPKSSRKARKGKAKEKENAQGTSQGPSNTKAPAAKQVHAQSAFTEDVDEWAWETLADSTVSHRPAVLTADGNYFFSITGTTVKIYSVSTGKVVSTLSSSSIGSSGSRVANGEGHTDAITTAIINPDNPFQLLTASLDGDIKIWDYLEAVLLQTICIGQPISHMCTHDKFKGQVFIAVPTKLKKNKSGIALVDKGNTMVYRVSLTPKSASTSQNSKSSDIVRIGKTKTAVSMAVSSSGSWLVVIAGHKAYVSLASSPESGFTKFVSPEKLTCLALHPVEDYFATGDERGQIRVWYCLNSQLVSSTSGEKRAQTTTMHWHAHAVSALSFTPNGAYLLSGGEENVLVIWQLHSGKKEFVPRLGSPVLAITVRQGNESEEEYLVGLADGSYLVIGAGSLSVNRTIPRMRLDPKGMGRPAHSPVPLACHLRNSTIILPASHPSSLQIYSPDSSSLVSELEVSASNRVSRRDEKPLEPSRVDYAVIDQEGEWMATLDKRDGDGEFSAEVYLKLWRWDSSTWILNTRIDHPHGTHAVLAISFRPNSDPVDLMTTGSDGSVKVWSIRSMTTKEGNTEVFWTSRSTSTFRSEIPLDAQWSPDGSVLAICLQRQIALYDPQSNQVLDYLTTSETRKPEAVKFVGSSGRYLLAYGRHHAVLWDLITRTVRWHHRSSLEIAHVLAHPKDDLILMIVQPYAQEGAARTSRVLQLNTKSPLPVIAKSIPFRFRAVGWYEFNGESHSLFGITYPWDVVVCGDVVSGDESTATIPKSIKDAADVVPKKTLFRDIFGNSAFEVSETIANVSIVLPQRQDGRKALALVDTPAYLAPPIETIFSSLMDSLLEQRLEPAAEVKEDVDEGEAEELIMDVDVPTPSLQLRTVEDKELDDLVALFREQAVGHVTKVGKVNGFPNGSHKVKMNGKQVPESPRSLPLHVNGSASYGAQEDIAVPAPQPVEAPSPSGIGKKRKKSTE